MNMNTVGNGGPSSSVPPGFRFHPTDEELLHYYLRKKVSYEPIDFDVIREVDLNKLEPWDIKEKCRIGSGLQDDWYLFSQKDKKYPTGTRTNRATVAGFWKATGRDKAVRTSNSNTIGMRKTLVFYTGRAPRGHKTNWIMHEYRLEDDDNASHENQHEDGWVICRVFEKKNHARSGFRPVMTYQDDPITLPSFHAHGAVDPKLYSDQDRPNNFTFDHNHPLHLPSSFLSSLGPMDAQCPPNLLRSTLGAAAPPTAAGDWSFLDKLMATRQTMDHTSVAQELSSRVGEVGPPVQRFPFSNDYYHGFEPDFARYSKQRICFED